MDYIEKLELQTEEVEEIETLEKHTIINNTPVSVNKYNGHTREFLAIGTAYDDGFNQLKETDGLGISCIVSKEVKEARKDVNGNVHAKLKNRIDSEVNEINSLLDTIVNTVSDSDLILKYGAKLDGVSDDTNAFRLAIKENNIILNKSYNILLCDTINVPNNRILDFAGSIITSNVSTRLFKYGSDEDTYFSGFGELRNIGNVIMKDSTILVSCTKTIFQKFVNIKVSQLKENTTIFNLLNCFNIIHDNCHVGYSNAGRVGGTNVMKVVCRTDNYLTVGVNNNTNSKVTNCLFQNATNGFLINGNDGSVDSYSIDNQGFTNCGTCINILGDPNLNHVIQISNSRIEKSDVGIINTSQMSINNLHLYHNKLSIKNSSNGRLNIMGNIHILSNDGDVGIENTGLLRLENSDIMHTSNTNFILNQHSRPWKANIVVNNTNNFDGIIEKINNVIVRQTVDFNLSDLPTNGVFNGTELKIYSWDSNLKIGIVDNEFYNCVRKGVLNLIFLDGSWRVNGSY